MQNTMDKIDIHSHILPGFDDGAGSLEESLKMLQMAAEQGFRKFIATPHYSRQYRNLCPEKIREQCAWLEEKAKASVQAEIRIYPGQELFYEDGLLQKLEEGKLLTLADSSYVLMEFAYSIPYTELYRALQRVRLAGLSPVLAHAERYPALWEEGQFPELIEAGILIQVNYGSLEGTFLEKQARLCRRLLERGEAHFLGTDMHDARRRPPRAEKTFAWMEKHLSGEQIEALCRGNAEKLLKNESIL